MGNWCAMTAGFVWTVIALVIVYVTHHNILF
jgi:hypothetical protein